MIDHSLLSKMLSLLKLGLNEHAEKQRFCDIKPE